MCTASSCVLTPCYHLTHRRLFDAADDVTVDPPTRPERADYAYYARSVNFNIELVEGGDAGGRIYVPYVTVEYEAVSSSDYDSNKEVTVSRREYRVSSQAYVTNCSLI